MTGEGGEGLKHRRNDVDLYKMVLYLSPNIHSGIIQNEVTMDDLFYNDFSKHTFPRNVHF